MSNISDKPWLVPGHMYQYDIGWLVDKLLSFETELNTAIDLKTIHYADPIQWDITTQYAPNTVVVDPKTGTAYMSKVPVPPGILLTNTDYWVVIFNYQRIYDKIMSGIAFNDKDNLNATKDLTINDLVWYGGDLYRCIRAIPKGTTYIPGTNLTPTTIEECLETYYGNDRAANVLNDTVNVSRDYTLNAGNIAETSGNRTVTSENSTETISGDKTVNGTNETKILSGKRTVSSNEYEETVAGNKTVSAGSLEEIVGGSKSVNAESLQETVTGNKSVNCGNYNITANNKTDKITGDYFIDTDNPIKYGEVTRFNNVFGGVRWRDKNGNPYNVLTSDDPSKILGSSLVDVRTFGAEGDGVTDDTKAIQDAIDWCVAQQKGYSVIITGGTYLISKTINLWYDYNTSLIIQGAILKASAEMDFMIRCGYRKTEHWEGFYPYGVFGQGVIDCNGLAGGILTKPDRVYTHIENVQIRNCEKVGISIGQATDTEISSAQYTIFNVCIFGNMETNAGNGIEDYHGDGWISHVFVYYKRVAMKLRAATFVDNVHIWGGMNFVGKAYEQEIIGISAGSSLYLSNAYIDTIPIGVYLNDGCECQCSNVMFMNGEDFVTTCFNANFDCSINVDQLNIVSFNNRVFNPLFLRNRPAANYFIGLKRFRATFTEKLTVNYMGIVFNEFNNLVVNPYVTTLSRNYGNMSAGYTLIGYVNSMRSRLNFKIDVAPLTYFDFDVEIATAGTANIKRNESVKNGGENIEVVFGGKITNDYGDYLPVYIHATTKPSANNIIVSVNVTGTQNGGFYPLVTGAISGNPVETSVTPALTVSVPTGP